MEPLGYARWEHCQKAIKRAIESYKTIGYDPDSHFHRIKKMVRLGSRAECAIKESNLQLSDRNGTGVTAATATYLQDPSLFG